MALLSGEIEHPTMDEMIELIDAGQCCSSCNRFFDSIDAHDEHAGPCEEEQRQEPDWVHDFERSCEDAAVRFAENRGEW